MICLWKWMIRKYPNLLVLFVGCWISACAIGVDSILRDRESRIISTTSVPNAMDASVLAVRRLSFYNQVGGGTFSLGVGIALTGVYLLIRARVVPQTGVPIQPPVG